MKEKDFNKIFKTTYRVHDDCLYFETKKLCNFFIKKICVNLSYDASVSFTVRLKSSNYEEEKTLPMMYWDSPYIWLKAEFDAEEFQICVSKEEYEKHIKYIIRELSKNEQIKMRNKTPGWNKDNDSKINLCDIEFYDYDNFSNISKSDYNKHNYIEKYVNLIDKNISVPLVAYLLSSTLSSLRFIPKDFDNNFIISLTGGTMRNRERVALMFTNVHNRSHEFCLAKQYFSLHHLLNTDTTAEILHKALAGKDSVIIAFEPNRKMYNYIKKIFVDNANDYKIQSNCLITTKYVEEIPFDTLNIDIPHNFNEKDIDNYFFDNYSYRELAADNFMENCYRFISELHKHIKDDQGYLKKEYAKFRNNICFEGLSHKAYNVAIKLCFSYMLYMKVYSNTNCKDDFRYIVSAAERSFPTDNELHNNEIRKIFKICRTIDNYFDDSKHRKYILGLDEIQKGDVVKLKYDDKHLYMRADIINEILKIAKFPGNFSVDAKRTLAENNFIDSYFKPDGKREYSVHLSTSRNGSNKIQTRYIAFNRENCRKKDLFPQIEKYIYENTPVKMSNRCQNR